MKTLEYHLDHLEISKNRFKRRVKEIAEEKDPERKAFLIESMTFYGDLIQKHTLNIVRLVTLQNQ